MDNPATKARQDSGRSRVSPLGIASTIVGILAALTLVAQVVASIVLKQVSALETALFSVLQFVFSLAFAWVLARIAAKKEFVESQKAFAIAAYRRINEIDEGVERLLLRAEQQCLTAAPEIQKDIELLATIAVGVRASIKSSISDWGDVIGDEIAALKSIGRIRREQEQEKSPDGIGTGDDGVADAQAPSTTGTGNKEELKKLLDSLPPSLRIIADDEQNRTDPVLRRVSHLRAELDSQKRIKFRAFHDDEMDGDFSQLQIGDPVKIKVGGGSKSRFMSVRVVDGEDRMLGILLNEMDDSYFTFREALVFLFETIEIDANVVEISAKRRGKRRYFTVNAQLLA